MPDRATAVRRKSLNWMFLDNCMGITPPLLGQVGGHAEIPREVQRDSTSPQP